MNALDCGKRAGDLFITGLGKSNHDWQYLPVFVTVVLTSLAILIIGSLGMAGILPGSTAGWTILGTAAGGCALRFCLGNLSERRFYLITCTLVAMTFVVLGALGGAGILSATQMGWGIVGTSIASPIIKFLFAHPHED